jgi:hypothetical protein
LDDVFCLVRESATHTEDAGIKGGVINLLTKRHASSWSTTPFGDIDIIDHPTHSDDWNGRHSRTDSRRRREGTALFSSSNQTPPKYWQAQSINVAFLSENAKALASWHLSWQAVSPPKSAGHWGYKYWSVSLLLPKALIFVFNQILMLYHREKGFILSSRVLKRSRQYQNQKLLIAHHHLRSVALN